MKIENIGINIPSKKASIQMEKSAIHQKTFSKIINN